MEPQSNIKYDDLEYLPEGVFLLNGEPFSGVAVDYNEEGAKISEVPFVNGQEHGMARSWYGNGQLKRESPYVMGSRRGLAREWFEDGLLRSESTFEFGILMKKEVHDRNQQIIEAFERPPSDVSYQNVLKRRLEAKE